jgi:hypothetical protein
VSNGSLALHSETDSEVIASQIQKECMARDKTLGRYLATVRRMENFFERFTVEHIERAKNTKADKLANAVARKMVLPPDVFFQTIKDPSIKIVEPEPRMVNIVQGEDWRASIMAYLRQHYEPDSSTDSTRLQQRVKDIKSSEMICTKHQSQDHPFVV